MPTHLYCLLAAESDSAPPTDAGDVRALRIGDIVAWVATTADEKTSREGSRAAQQVVEHDRVIAHALARDVTPVPATLADPYPSDQAAIADIAKRRDEITESLRRVDGTVEMAVILAAPAAVSAPLPDGDPGPGRTYLERLREGPKLLKSISDELDRRLEGVALVSSRRAERDRIGLSHLVRRRDVDAYRAIARDFASKQYRMVVDGPRAPYSFGAFSPTSGVANSSGPSRA